MKITCNIIEDLLPLYVDDMVSEDSRKLVEEHLKGCPACRKMQEEMMRENRLTAGIKDSNSVQINKTEAESLKKIRRRIRKKRILSVILAVVLVAAAGGAGHYWYYDKENYISWDAANISVKDGKVYSTVSPLGRLKSILSVDQKNMFYMMSETMWTRRQYPSDPDTENELWSLQDFQEAHDRSDDAVTDETSLPSGIENVYYVDPENVKEACRLWDYQDDPQEAQKKAEELAAKSHLIWSAEK
nr:zf-HC2 domain-containing protein [uncultured Blautia sp.]